eukprot:TRINITY_DN3392_c0_g1_i1.p1 TRINITY_DN3392_c0_g1~~TRINITY_DN3392_c0_g1_i1.p1  ORF type:complete len:587 (-),score=105.35 TRINITY_DN3392_c0_g1_i1:30-1790(-)
MFSIKPRHDWKDENKPSAMVCSVVEPNEDLRKGIVGVVRNLYGQLRFCPDDNRFPHILFNPKKKKKISTDYLYKCDITSWPDESKFPTGRLSGRLGRREDFYSELSISFDMSSRSEMTDEIQKEIEILKNKPLDFENRKDFRDRTIFSIDSETTIDIDDAISFEELEDGVYRIGVYIADVTSFIDGEKTPHLEKYVYNNVSSIYLPMAEDDHMFPKDIVQQFSLIEGEDRLALSIAWVMDSTWNIIEENIDECVIRSSKRLTYEIVEEVLRPENDDKELVPENIKKDLQKLLECAECYEKQRIENNRYNVHPSTSDELTTPKARKLVSEIMVLANKRIGETLVRHNPIHSLLYTQSTMSFNSTKFLERANYFGMKFSSELPAVIEEIEVLDEFKRYFALHLLSQSVRASTRSRYSLSKDVPEEEIYAHFTSPIRRFTDMIVHRQIKSILQDLPFYTNYTEDLENIAKTYKKNNNIKYRMLSYHLSMAYKIQKPEKCLFLKYHQSENDKIVLVYCPVINTVLKVSLFDCKVKTLRNQTYEISRSKKETVLSVGDTFEPILYAKKEQESSYIERPFSESSILAKFSFN